MKLEEHIVALNKAIKEQKAIQFCWGQETAIFLEDNLVLYQCSYRAGADRINVEPRVKETFLLLVPWNNNWLLYLNSSGRTLMVKNPMFRDTRGLIEFWFQKVSDEQWMSLFV